MHISNVEIGVLRALAAYHVENGNTPAEAVSFSEQNLKEGVERWTKAFEDHGANHDAIEHAFAALKTWARGGKPENPCLKVFTAEERIEQRLVSELVAGGMAEPDAVAKAQGAMNAHPWSIAYWEHGGGEDGIAAAAQSIASGFSSGPVSNGSAVVSSRPGARP